MPTTKPELRIADTSVQQSDWTPVDETVRMLQLAMAQIETALCDSDESVDDLISTFTTIVEQQNRLSPSRGVFPIGCNVKSMQASPQPEEGQLSRNIQNALAAFKFYDKLSQRLKHVSNSMKALGALLTDQEKLVESSEWQKLHSSIKSRYSMREESELFASLMDGDDVEELLRSYREKRLDAVSYDGDVEYF